MIIEIKVFASLRHHIPASDSHLEDNKWNIKEGATVAQVLELLNIPEEEARIFLINGRKVERTNTFREGDLLHIFPQMAGG